MKFHLPAATQQIHTARNLAGAAVAASLGALLFTSTLAAPAALASPHTAMPITTGVSATTGAVLSTEERETPLFAPDGTAEIWLDVEAATAGAAITATQTRTGQDSWADTVRASTPFGSAARAAMVPGDVDARWQVTQSFRADVAVTFADMDGTVLGERLLRDARFVAENESTWVTWAELVTPTPAPDDATADDSDDGSATTAAAAAGASGRADAQGRTATADAQGGAANAGTQSQASLSKTGSNLPSWIWLSGLVAVVGGAAVAGTGVYRRAHRRGEAPNKVTAHGQNIGGDQ